MNLPRLEYFDGNGALFGTDGDGVGRALMWDGDASPEELREIARRCNQHEALISALREATDLAMRVGDGVNEHSARANAVYRVCRAALAGEVTP